MTERIDKNPAKYPMFGTNVQTTIKPYLPTTRLPPLTQISKNTSSQSSNFQGYQNIPTIPLQNTINSSSSTLPSIHSRSTYFNTNSLSQTLPASFQNRLYPTQNQSVLSSIKIPPTIQPTNNMQNRDLLVTSNILQPNMQNDMISTSSPYTFNMNSTLYILLKVYIHNIYIILYIPYSKRCRNI